MFRVEVIGTGFSAEIEGKHKDVGFLCVRVVRSATEAEARDLAINEVRNLSGFKALVAAQHAKTRHELSIDEVVDLGESRPDDTDSAGTGLILFDARL